MGIEDFHALGNKLGRTAALPRPSLCLNIPKTGSSFTSRFVDAADWLELRRRCGLGRLSAPNRASLEIARRIKRYGPAWGNLTCRFWDHHAGYSSLPPDLRRHPKLCALRDLRGWYCSFYLYYTTAMTDTLLSRAIRLLVGGDATAVRDRSVGAIVYRHRKAFLERFRNEDAGAGSIGNLSMEFVVWFNRTVRLEVMMKRWVGMDGTPSARTGFLTFRAITVLFDDPGKVFRMRAGERDAYFASGSYLQELRCDFFLDFDRLTDQLPRVMVDDLGYTPEIVAFLKHNGGRVNVSREDGKSRAMRELDAGDWFGRTREDEAVYETYLLPLAGSRLPIAQRGGNGRSPGRTR